MERMSRLSNKPGSLHFQPTSNSGGIKAFTQHAMEGLSKLPTFLDIETYRGTDLPQGILDRMTVGSIESDKAFFSTSEAAPFSGIIQMVVRGVSGKDISFLSHLPESEILFPPRTRFEILNRIESGSTTHLLFKEIP